MKKKFLSLLLALITSFGTMFAAVSINGLWYNLDEENGTAEIWKPVNNTYYGDLDIPASVTYNDKEYVVNSIGGSAFAWCSGGPTNVTIPNTVKRIGESAFSWCTDLTSISIPNSVTYIGKNAFQSCTNLTSITLPSSIDTIHEHTFDYCKNLVSIIIPNSVKCIGDYAFDDCNILESIIIPDSVTSIGDGAFWKCYNLTSVTIGKSVTDIATSAFWSCGITSVVWKAIACNNFISVDYLSPIFENTVQSFTFGDEVEIIPALLCEGMNQLTSITLPVSVTSIGERAFENCSNLVGDLVIPDNVVTIGAEAFSKCTNLSSVTIGKKVRTVGDYAFLSCLNLKSVNISDLSAWCTIKFGNSEANPLAGKLYLNGVLVTDLLIPNDVTCIENYVFRSCSLKSLKISENVTSIGEHAFYYCDNMKGALIIPNSVTSIGNQAFSYCDSLNSLTIGKNVASIGKEAFFYCNGLTEVICLGDKPATIGDYSFYSESPAPIYVPCDKVDLYKQAWTDYAERIQCHNLPSTTITVRLKASSASNWSSVYLWAWTDEGNIFSEWPGQKINKDADGWYSYTFAQDISKVSIIWNNGSGAQTKDITGITGSTCYTLNSTTGSSIEVSIVDCDAQGIEDIHVEMSKEVHKLLRNSQILILRGAHTYTLTGQEVK